MTTHKILTIILLILAIFLGVSILIQNKKTDQGNIPAITNEQVVLSTTTVKATETPAAPVLEKFEKDATLTTQNYFEFPDNSILSLKKINDSRCAANVNCVWAGNIIAIFNIKQGNTLTQDFDLKFGPGAMSTSYTYNGYTIQIKSIAPDKSTTNQILGQKDYIVTVHILK